MDMAFKIQYNFVVWRERSKQKQSKKRKEKKTSIYLPSNKTLHMYAWGWFSQWSRTKPLLYWGGSWLQFHVTWHGDGQKNTSCHRREHSGANRGHLHATPGHSIPATDATNPLSLIVRRCTHSHNERAATAWVRPPHSGRLGCASLLKLKKIILIFDSKAFVTLSRNVSGQRSSQIFHR